MGIKTHLVKKTAGRNTACTNCSNKIEKGETFHLEEGVDQHLHSLIARKFCSKCYGKYGVKKLLAKEK